MKIGFTGSSTVVTLVQEISLKELLLKWKSKNELAALFDLEGHHGDCIKADEVFHNTCLDLDIPIIIHPPNRTNKRAFCKGYSEIREPKDYLLRNRDIVWGTEVLIAVSDSYKEKLRSGTWSTIRYARKLCRDIFIIYPNGVVEHEKRGDCE